MKRVGLLVGTESAYGRGIWLGVRDYVRPRRSVWVFRGIQYEARDPVSARRLDEWGVDGIVAHIHRPEMVLALQRLDRPIVNTSNTLPQTPFNRVGVDDCAVGRVAADYYVAMGFRHFAFLGVPGVEFSRQRGAGFAEAVARAGCTAAVYAPEPEPVRPADRFARWHVSTEAVRQWLQNRPRPTALFACNDELGSQVGELCEQIGLRIPEDICVLGADDDELLCEFAAPPLSSVRIPARRIGQAAARMLDCMMTGGTPTVQPRLLLPGSVTERLSTELTAVRDAEVAKALRFIRDHAGERIRVRDIVAQVGICRSLLERRFRLALSRSPLTEIRRVRLARARELLLQTSLSIEDVARTAGFRDAKHLHPLFRQATGATPAQYRRHGGGLR